MAEISDSELRLARLNRAMNYAKLLPANEVLSSKPMSELVGCTWVTLRKWCDTIPDIECSNAFVRGGRGVDWIFYPVAAIEVFLKHFTSIAKKESDGSRAFLRGAGIDVSETEPVLEMRLIPSQYNITCGLIDRKIQQGKLISTQRCIDHLEDIFRSAREQFMSMNVAMDPLGLFSHAQKKQMDEIALIYLDNLYKGAVKVYEN